MKLIYVVDSIADLNNKINLLKHRLCDNIFYVVKADLVDLFATYGYKPHAIYYNNLSEIINILLRSSNADDLIICYASLQFDNNLLTHFTKAIGNKTKVVNLTPKYNTFEKLYNSAYNVYVKSLFKLKDSLATPKLQFLPVIFVEDLLNSHIANRMFELNSDYSKEISVENKEINKSMKSKNKSLKYNLISLIIALVLTIGLLTCIAYLKVNFILVFIFIILFALNLLMTIIFQFKARFDKRFLK